MAEQNTEKRRDRVGRTLYWTYLLFLVASIILTGAILYYQLIFEPEPVIAQELTPSVTKRTLPAHRGTIKACDGRVLAMTFPNYTVAMDCSVRRSEFEASKDSSAVWEQRWRAKARALANELPRFFPQKTADEYYNQIIADREAGRMYRKIGGGIDYLTLQEIKKLPLFNEASYKGGLIVEQQNIREYPYGTLARRTVGFVRMNAEASTNTNIGLEGKFDHILRGKDGYDFLRRADGGRRVTDNDSTYRKPTEGMDVVSTLNVDFQDLADKALRRQIDTNYLVEGGCAIVMDVKTGAIRAMVNLKRNNDGQIEESYNYAIGRKGEPGSVFKLTTLMTLIEDGYVKSLEETIPTHHGILGQLPQDSYITNHERQTGLDEITIRRGLEISSNYVFAYLATQHYKDDTRRMIDKLYTYKLGEAFNFDLDGMATPDLPKPEKALSLTDLGTTAYGYSVAVTPMHILTFYNAIANHGKMMKPYLVEQVERNGKVEIKYGPSVLNESICSRATADTLTRGLVAVVQDGTGSRLKGAPCAVAGKTGTARILLSETDSKEYANKYTDGYGRKKHQGTFVGFFPAEEPRYSIICTIYSVLSGANFYGGTIPALAVREIVDGICASDPSWRSELRSNGSVPLMAAGDIEIDKADEEKDGHVPDVTGMGLKDAIYAIESAGLICKYSGAGHVSSQSPKSGSVAKMGDIVRLTLK